MSFTDEQLALARANIVPNTMKEAMAAGKLTWSFGLRKTFSLEMPMMAKVAGYHSILLNMEHSRTGLETMSEIACQCLNIGVTPMIVAPRLTEDWISRAIDCGVQGVIVPRIGTAEQAATLVKFAKHRPLGERPLSEGPQQNYHAMPPAAVMHVLNDTVLACPMIETVEGLENAEAICMVPGVDMVFVGTFDLTDDMGIVGQYDHPRVEEALTKICAAAEAGSKANGAKIFVGAGGLEKRPDLLEKFVSKFPNLRYVMAGRDSMNQMKAQASAMKEISDSLQ
ncbi:hypothetical protein MNV49_001254 [Pseudohyphozyma bogoriensis]|nr:hypothetical protein MNV49_001254 [Pseudohyphozyma bogoriensis]